ncbi:MAG: hypothetical protein A2Z18_11415 [Armatimonadetes bacterium RBG_16_58_9]|nr:MAG: hypothetical protein A2Z18_11415 [Armatimonadetes bacterium RBG_16_58_9]
MNSEKLNELSKQIRSPVPFWFINGRVEEWQIVREFEMMNEKGIREVIVHPRFGLEAEYLSDEWFEIFGWCVREAKKRGMHVWIYDELNWPSGTAGMSVVQMNPDYQGKYLAVEAAPLSEIDLDRFEPGLYMAAANIEGGQATKTREVVGVDALAGLSGPWHIFNCKLKRDRWYIDTLLKRAVDCFKHVTYDEYYKRFGDEFGKTIRAVYTDEPSIYWVTVGYDDWNLPYTDDYFETFEQRYGYRVAPMIPYLFYPGRESASFRANYWEHAGYLFNERYHGNLGAWCREHGVIYTGHNNHEEPLRYQIRFQGDMFGTMRAMDIPGVDHLEKQTLGNSWISIIGHKICSSQAHVSGKARCMSESFGVMGWDTTYTNLKRVTDWQFALGINLLIPRAFHHTISGMTKRESPPSFFYQSPHWDDFDYFRAYLNRLEEMLRGGRHLCKVAVMFPSSGLWASYESDCKTSEFEYTDNFLNSLCLELVKNQIDFDLVDYPALSEAALEDGKMRLADEQYEFLIVPATPYMRDTEIARLSEIVGAGVKTTLFHRSMEPIPQNLPDGMAGARFVRTEEIEGFVDSLKTELDDDIQIKGGGAGEIMAYRREKDGGKITFLLNRSDKHRKVTAYIKNYPDPAVFDQETGAYVRLRGRQAGSKTQAQLRFQPNQSYFLVSNVENAASVPETKGEAEPIEIRDLRVEVPFNVASIYHFLYSKEGDEPHEVDVRSNPRFMPGTWNPETPDFEAYAGDYECEVDIDCDPAGIRMIVDKDFAECKVYVNGTLVELNRCCSPSPQPSPPGGEGVKGASAFTTDSSAKGEGDEVSRVEVAPRFLTDFQDVCADVGALLRRGTNRLRVVSPTKLSEPVRLVGDFRVHIKGQNVEITDQGDVNPFRLEMDYPFYSGTATYRAEFAVDKAYSSLVLNLHDARDAASVLVNGNPVGKRLWAPYTLDLAEFAVVGSNTLEVDVRNNMTNLILGNPRSLGLVSIPTLSGFE